MLSYSVKAMIGESSVAKNVSQIQKQFPNIAIGSYPFIKDGKVGVNLVSRGVDLGQLEQAHKAISEMIATKTDEIFDDE